MVGIWKSCAVLWLCVAPVRCAITTVDWTKPDSVKRAASEVAYTLLTFYKGNETGQIPGLLPPPSFWWMAGGMMGSLIQYWHYTGDTTYNALVMQAMQFQVGAHNDYMPINQTASMGNDDQAFWALAALAAAENKFPDPLPTQPGWLALAQAVFNEQAGRWDTQYCNGGLRWQVPLTNSGYDLKNTISNGCFFNLAARLARYTGDQHYADWAVKAWDWMYRIGLFDDQYNVYDSTEADLLNCTTIGHNQWTYNAGTLLMGASTMYNFTNGSDLWRNHTQGLLNTIEFDFFPDNKGVMKDICEEYNACNYDQVSFKAYLARWMAVGIQMAPFTYNQSHTLLVKSAQAAVAQCNGGPSGKLCGQKWYNNGVWDGTQGPGQQMAALEVILGTLVNFDSVDAPTAPVTNATGGTSPSNPSAGYNASAAGNVIISPATKSGKAGAWFLTAFLALLALFMWVFMSTTLFEDGRSTVAGGKRKRSRLTMMRALEKSESPVIDLSNKGKGKGVEQPIASPRATLLMQNGHRRTDSLPVMAPISEHGDSMKKSVKPIYRGGDDLT